MSVFKHNSAFPADHLMTSLEEYVISSGRERGAENIKMLVKRIDPDLITFTSLLLLSIVQNVFCRPKGARRGSSIAVFGGGAGGNFMPSDKWGVLTTGTKVLICVLCILILIFMLIGLYRAYVWCTKDSGRR